MIDWPVWLYLGGTLVVALGFARLLAAPVCLDPERFSLRCRLFGTHPSEWGSYDVTEHMGMGIFGGPTYTHRWVCRRCGGRCSQ